MLSAVMPVFIIFTLASIGYGGYLHYRYVQPYRLYKSTLKERLKWAFHSSLFTFLPFFFLGLMYPLITPDENTQWWYSLVCGGFSLLLLPILVLGMMANFLFANASNKRLDKYIKKSRIAGLNNLLPTFFILDKETKQFFEEGFPEDIVEGEQREPA